MPFTLVLIPVTIVWLLAGLVTLGYGLIAFGHLVGTVLPIGRDAFATALGVALTLIGLWLVGSIPLGGDLVVIAVLLAGVGAVLVTYLECPCSNPTPCLIHGGWLADKRSPGSGFVRLPRRLESQLCDTSASQQGRESQDLGAGDDP